MFGRWARLDLCSGASGPRGCAVLQRGDRREGRPSSPPAGVGRLPVEMPLTPDSWKVWEGWGETCTGLWGPLGRVGESWRPACLCHLGTVCGGDGGPGLSSPALLPAALEHAEAVPGRGGAGAWGRGAHLKGTGGLSGLLPSRGRGCEGEAHGTV